MSLLVLVASLAISSLVIPQNPRSGTAYAASAANMENASGDVIAAAEAIIAAFGHNDREAYFALFDPDATFLFYTTPYRLNSRGAYEQEWAKWVKESGFRVRSCSSSDQKVQLFGDVAIFTHSVRTEISSTDGDSTLYERETIVFHRSNGRWIAVHEHLSPQPEQRP